MFTDITPVLLVSVIAYIIYSEYGPSIYVCCVICYCVIAAPCAKCVDLCLCNPLHYC